MFGIVYGHNNLGFYAFVPAGTRCIMALQIQFYDIDIAFGLY